MTNRSITQQIEGLMYEYRCLRAAGIHPERLATLGHQLADLGVLTDLLLVPELPKIPTHSRQRSHAQMLTVNWAGPFTQHDFNVTGSSWGLYFFRGKCKAQRYSRIQYCGITEQYFSERFRNHHKLHDVRRDLEIWLGRIVNPRRVTRSLLEQAEHMIIHALDLPLNEQCRTSEPPPTTIISQWYDRYGQRQHNPYSDFSSVMVWDGEMWQKGSLERWI